MNVGKELRKMRKDAGMSQEDIAHELHMSISNISRIETGKYEAKMIDVWKWANTTQSQEVLAAIFLGIDVGILQQALEIVSTTSIPGLILSIF